tara:strand:+ start:32331 stop:35576 length:3246 start_codon:yes stop_codon:yes gene_type:complete
MAKKKKNIKNQTFDVYPYLDQYQYLMRNGGQLPWYQTEGPIEEETVDKKLEFKEWVLQDPVNRQGANAQEQYQEYLKGTPSKENIEDEETNGTRGGDYTDESVDNKCICPEGWERAGEEYFSSGSCSPTKSTCGEQISENAKNNDGEGDGSPEGEGCEKSVYFECAKKGLKVDPATCTCIEKVEESSETDKQKAIQDYQNGKISKKEMENIVNSHNLGKGTKKGTPDYEISPTSKWGLLGDAVGSTVGTIKGFGRQSINPKTGKPYTRADFKQTTIDTSKIKNESGAQLYWDDANLQKFIETGDKNTKLSDIIGTQGMHSSRRFDDFQDYRQTLVNEYDKEGHLNTNDVASRQSMDRTTGDITYDDVEYEEEVTEDNPDFNPDEEESETNQKTITKTVTKTRAFDPENDKTEYDKARDNTKDYSTTDVLVNPDADVTSIVRTGPEADPNVIDLEGNMTSLQIEKYDSENDYTDNKKVIKKTSEEIKKEKREDNNNNDNNDDGNDNPSGLIEESRVDNGDGTVTIKYNNGATKIIKTPESSQQKKNRIRKENNKEASMGLEMFVYGGQKDLDKYQTQGEKVHKFLEYTPDFPRTSVVPYKGNHTAVDLQNAITRDSIRIENDLADSWMYRNLMGQDKNHQSNQGPAGKLQLNREWLHKLLMQDDQERVEKLNFYRNGGTLPFYEDGEETDLLKPPADINEEVVEIPEVVEEEANLTEEEMNELDETTVKKSGVVESKYGNLANRAKAYTKTGIADRAINTYGDISNTVTKWADFGSAVSEGWQNDAAQTKAETENTDAESQFMVQESSQGIHDVNSGDSFTNDKVDEIYSGNNMKAPLIVQQGGNPQQMAQQQMAQPVVDNVNYAALTEFTGSNPYNVEIGYSPEVIAYQKQIMAKMAHGGQLPMAKDGWWDSVKEGASNLYDSAKETYDNTDFKTPINKALDYSQTAMSAAGMIPVVGNAVDLVNAGVSGARGGYAAATGDTEGVKDHAENAALNLASAVPGAGQVAGGMALAKDTAKYAGMDGSVSTNIANAITPTTTPSVQITENKPEINKVAKYGTEVEVDYELLQELIKAGADIEII